MRISFLLFLCLIFSSCHTRDELPEGILAPEKMQIVFWDYLRSDIYAEDFLKADSSLNIQKESAALQKELFEKHHVSRDDFFRSYRYYSDHPELMRNMLDSMVARQQRMPANSKRKKLKVFDLKEI
jgi:hypothetical protein